MRIIKPVFLDEKNGKFKVISFAKKARGLMSRYIIENRLTKPEQLTAFNSEGYFFDEKRQGKASWCLNATSSKQTPPAGGVCINGVSSPGRTMIVMMMVTIAMLIRGASGYRASHNAPSTSHGRASGRRPSSARCYPDRQSAVLPQVRG
jgi:hypothetical protein